MKLKYRYNPNTPANIEKFKALYEKVSPVHQSFVDNLFNAHGAVTATNYLKVIINQPDKVVAHMRKRKPIKDYMG